MDTPLHKTVYFFLFTFLFNAAHAEIYTYHDKAGKKYFTDTRMGNAYKLISVYRETLTQTTNQTFNFEKYQHNKLKFAPKIKNAAIIYRLDPKLLHAIIDVESAFNPKALSKTGAAGLMQLMPATAKDLGVDDRWNPQQNIMGGARYFRSLMDMFHQDIKLSLAAYNAGMGAVKRAGYKIPNYPETKRYVKKVITLYNKLSQTI